MRRRLTILFFCMLLAPVVAETQTLTQRQQLSTDLTDLLDLGTDGSLQLDWSDHGTGTVRTLDGCGPLFDSTIYLDHLGGGAFRLYMITSQSDSTDITSKAHTLVCDLNAMLRHAHNGSHSFNDTGNAVHQFAASCSGPQPYFMVDTDVDPISFETWKDDKPWSPTRSHYGLYRDDTEERRANQILRGSWLIVWDSLASLNPANRGTLPVYVAKHPDTVTLYREEGPNEEAYDAVTFRRANFMYQFDYRWRDLDTVVSTTPYVELDIPDEQSADPTLYADHADSSYVLPWAVDATIPRLDSIQLVHQLHAYPNEQCNPPSYLGMRTGSAATTVRVFYTIEDTQYEREYVESLDEVADLGGVSETDSISEINRQFWNSYLTFGKAHEKMEFVLDTIGNVVLVLTDSASSWSTGNGDEDSIFVIQARSPVIPPDTCSIVFPDTTGIFVIDTETGDLVYEFDEGERYPVSCLSFCEPYAPTFAVSEAITTTATTWSDDWTYDEDIHGQWATGDLGSPFSTQASNAIERGERGKYRPNAKWAYRTDARSAVDHSHRLFESSGVFVQPGTDDPADALELINRAASIAEQDDRWLAASTVTEYAPAGNPVEEKDILDIYSSARFAYGGIVPSMVSGNAEYGAIDFESFEDPYDPIVVAESDGTTAHTGQYSMRINPSETTPGILDLTVADGMIASSGDEFIPNALLIRFWLRRTYENSPPGSEAPVVVSLLPEEGPLLDPLIGCQQTDFKNLPSQQDSIWDFGTVFPIAKTGAWTLYQVVVDNIYDTAVGNDFSIAFEHNINGTDDTVWVDDVRAQPLSSQATCYVYDRDDLRLIAQFDDQHFSARYQYNGEGKLVRRIIETEEGVVTVAENHFGGPRVQRTLPETGGGSTIGPPAGDRISHALYSSTRDRDARAQRIEALLQRNVPTTDFNLLSVTADREGITMGTFGGEKVDPVTFLNEFRNDLDFDSIDVGAIDPRHVLPDLPDSAARAALDNLMRLDDEILNAADTLAMPDIDQRARERIERRLQTLESEREELLRETIGTDVQAVRNLYRDLKTTADDLKSDDNDQESSHKRMAEPDAHDTETTVPENDHE